jgi:hypothetical protein
MQSHVVRLQEKASSLWRGVHGSHDRRRVRRKRTLKPGRQRRRESGSNLHGGREHRGAPFLLAGTIAEIWGQRRTNSVIAENAKDDRNILEVNAPLFTKFSTLPCGFSGFRSSVAHIGDFLRENDRLPKSIIPLRPELDT